MSTLSRWRVDGAVDVVTAGRLAVPVVVVVLWELLSLGYPETISSPGRTLDVLVGGFTNGWLVHAMYVTFSALLVSILLAVVIGVPIGLWLGFSRYWGEAYEPLLLGTYSIPKVVLLPLFLLAFGIGVKYRIAFAAFHGIFPIAIVVMGGVKSIDEIHLKVGRIFQLSRWETFREIIAPSMSLPLLIALRLGFNLTFLGLILGELFQSSAGLGFQLMRALQIVDTGRIFAVNVVIVVVAVGINFAMYKVEGHFSRRSEYTASARP